MWRWLEYDLATIGVDLEAQFETMSWRRFTVLVDGLLHQPDGLFRDKLVKLVKTEQSVAAAREQKEAG